MTLTLSSVDDDARFASLHDEAMLSGQDVDQPVVKLIYVAGYGRSGTTLLDIALGEHPAIMGAGEVSTLARHVWDNDEYCACGSPVRNCPVWSRIVDQWGRDEPEDLIAQYRSAQKRTEGIVGWTRLFRLAGWRDHNRRTLKLLRSMATQSGRSILVDSSKLPGRGFVLAGMSNVELHVVHVVRDGRGVAWSLMKGHRRQVEKGLQRELLPKPLIYTAIRWATVNLITEILCRRVGPQRSIRVRYEDFVADPHATVGKIVALVGEKADDQSGMRPLSPQHQVAGSRHRMQRSIVVRKDEKWKNEMPVYKQRLFTLLCGVLLRRYGYPLRGSLADGPSS